MKAEKEELMNALKRALPAVGGVSHDDTVKSLGKQGAFSSVHQSQLLNY
jgi:hypothetical protein